MPKPKLDFPSPADIAPASPCCNRRRRPGATHYRYHHKERSTSLRSLSPTDLSPGRPEPPAARDDEPVGRIGRLFSGQLTPGDFREAPPQWCPRSSSRIRIEDDAWLQLWPKLPLVAPRRAENQTAVRFLEYPRRSSASRAAPFLLGDFVSALGRRRLLSIRYGSFPRARAHRVPDMQKRFPNVMRLVLNGSTRMGAGRLCTR